MKRYILLLSLLLVRECVLAQVSLPHRSVTDKGNIGKSRLIRQADGELIYVTATGGNFYSGRILANSEIDDTYNGERTSKKLSHLIKCKTLTAKQDKWGRFLIAGSSCIDSASGHVATMTRLTKTGDPDAEFQPGTVQMRVGDSSEFNGIYLQKDEKIVAIGTCYKDGRYRFFFSGLQYNGETDMGFGSNGILIDNAMPGNNKVVATVAQADGKYVVVGNNNTDGLSNIIVAKYNVDGQRDSTFGNKGISLTAVAEYGYVSANNVLLQADNKILVAGTCAGEKEGQDIFIVRYNVDGSVDPSFGKSGIVRADVTPDDRIDDMILLPDGRILLSGAGAMKGEKKFSRYIMLRLSPDGVMDNLYGYGSEKGFVPSIVGAGYAALAHNIAVSPRDSKVYRLSELISENETETVLVFTTFLQDSALGIMDIPTGRLQNSVYPVPITKSFTFSFELIEDLNISIKLQDISGKELATVVANQLYKEGDNNVTINFPPNCKPGKYLVVLSSEAGYKVTVEVTKI